MQVVPALNFTLESTLTTSTAPAAINKTIAAAAATSIDSDTPVELKATRAGDAYNLVDGAAFAMSLNVTSAGAYAVRNEYISST